MFCGTCSAKNKRIKTSDIQTVPPLKLQSVTHTIENLVLSSSRAHNNNLPLLLSYVSQALVSRNASKNKTKWIMMSHQLERWDNNFPKFKSYQPMIGIYHSVKSFRGILVRKTNLRRGVCSWWLQKRLKKAEARVYLITCLGSAPRSAPSTN